MTIGVAIWRTLDARRDRLRLVAMTRLSSTKYLSGLLALAATIATAAPVLASSSDAAPQCGGEKDGKSTSKPAPSPTPAPKPPA